MTEACSGCVRCSSAPAYLFLASNLPAREDFEPDLGMAWQTFHLELPMLVGTNSVQL